MLDIDPYTGRERTPSPGLAMLRSIGHRARRVRSGLAQTQMLILLGVIAAIIVLGIGGFAIYRSVTSGSQDTATKQNIDRVALALENYWQQFAADRYGVADIDLVEACNYVNSQFTQQEDLRIRTLMVRNGVAALLPGTTTAAGPATGLAQQFAYIEDNDEAQANCPTGEDGINVAAVADVLVADGTTVIAATAGTTITGGDGRQEWNGNDAQSAATGPTLDNFQSSGFSQQSVWIMQPTTLALRPGGTDIGLAADWSDGNELLIIGGISPSGNSYCLIKVFNATDRTHIGDYRYAHTYDSANPRVAVCTQGTNGTPPTGMTRNAGWPG